MPYAKTTIIQSSGIALPKGFLKLSPGMEEMAAGQIPSLGKALQPCSIKLCTLEHFHRPSRHTPAHAASCYENSYNTALPTLLQTLETGRTQDDCMSGPHRTQWRHLLCNVEQTACLCCCFTQQYRSNLRCHLRSLLPPTKTCLYARNQQKPGRSTGAER